MNIENALKIEGWMKPEELLWLAEQASKHKHIAEIGSWMGRSTRAMADNTEGVIRAVDTWKGSDEKTHKQILADKPAYWLYDQFMQNVGADHIATGRIIAYPLPSLEVAKLFVRTGFTFDMIFIDAAHDYENVKADILAWRPLLESGGLLCGHDFSGALPGVVQAVREVVPNPKMAGAGSIWVAG